MNNPKQTPVELILSGVEEELSAQANVALQRGQAARAAIPQLSATDNPAVRYWSVTCSTWLDIMMLANNDFRGALLAERQRKFVAAMVLCADLCESTGEIACILLKVDSARHQEPVMNQMLKLENMTRTAHELLRKLENIQSDLTSPQYLRIVRGVRSAAYAVKLSAEIIGKQLAQHQAECVAITALQEASPGSKTSDDYSANWLNRNPL